ncbi:hypothetical protein D3C75_621620 [compost metagenome]
MILIGLPLLNVLADFAGNKISLIMLGIPAEHFDLRAFVRIRPQLLRLAAGVQRYNAIGGVQNIGGRAVVLLQQDSFGLRVILFKV